MEFFTQWLKRNRGLLAAVLNTAKERKVKLYLVGGVLRDILLKREKENPDWDFCLRKGAINFSRVLAKKFQAGFVVLDQLHGCGRVVKKIKDKIYTLDFSDFRGQTLEEDLLHRDFSLNSMAVELEDLLGAGSLNEILIDPHSGKKDLAFRLIRTLNKDSFDEDPLRILRTFSLASLFDLKIAPATLRQAKRKKKKILKVSAERIRDELFRLLSGKNSAKFLKALEEHGILELIFPEIKPMRRMKKRSKLNLDVWGHSLESVKKVESLLDSSESNSYLKEYLEEEISSGRKRRELIKLATLLHDVGKPKTFRLEKNKVTFYGHDRLGSRMLADIGMRLKLSNEEIQSLRKMVGLHLRPGFLVTNPVLTARARFRFFRDAQREAVSVLFIAWADERSTKNYLLLDKIRKRYERIIPKLIREYFSRQQEEKPVRLIDGNDLMENFKLKPSPLIGKILTELEELQAVGVIKTKAEALKIVPQMIKKASKSRR